MAVTRLDRIGDGSTTIYDVSFALGYLKKDYIYVYLRSGEYANQLDYAWINQTQIELNSPLGVGVEFSIRRVVPRNTPVNDYEAGAILRESNLDDSFVQSLMILEEIEDGYVSAAGDFLVGSDIDMQGNNITNLAPAVELNDAVTLDQMTRIIAQNTLTGAANGSTPKHSVESLEGWTRALFAAAGIADNGVEDTEADSQRLQALEKLNKTTFSTLSEVDGNVTLGKVVMVEDYATNNNSGNLFFKVVAAGTGTHDGGKFIDLPVSGLQLEQNLNKDYSVKYWGAKGNNIAIDSTPIKATIAYVSSLGGGIATTPEGIYPVDSVDIPDNVTLSGYGDAVSVLRGVNTGLNSYVVKLSNSAVGVYPYGVGKTPIKSVGLKDIGVNASGLDFGIYVAYCLFPVISGVKSYNARIRNLFMAAVFSYSIDRLELSACKSVGGSIGENIFSWVGGDEGIICNAGNSRRLFCFGNGTEAAYNKVTSPEAGAGLIVRGGSGNTFTSFQGEGNKGVGVYVKPSTQATFYGIYLEANANDGTTEFRQVVNESSAAIFYDVEPRFNSTDTFYAAADTTLFNYLGARITGSGNVSLYGKFSNVTVENPLVHTIKLSEASNVDSAGASTRHTILKPSRYSTINSYKTNIWQMGVFIAFRSTQTVAAGKSILVRTAGLTTLSTLSVPTGTYVDGDVIYLPLLVESLQLESASVVNLAYGAGWVGIGQIDIGMYIKVMV